MRNTRQVVSRPLAALLFVVLAVAGCRSATSPDPHARPSGVFVTIDGTEVVRVEGSTSTGTFEVPVGGTTDELVFTFINAQGDPVSPPPDYHLELQFANAAVATFEPTGTPYSFRGRIRGLQAGATTVRMRFMHGPPGHTATHADYSSNPPTGVIVVD